jgi:hypothetical protein
MEDNRAVFKDKKLPCALCERELDIRVDKKSKPYVVCDSCGMQMFVRNQSGWELLKKKVSPKKIGLVRTQ